MYINKIPIKITICVLFCCGALIASCSLGGASFSCGDILRVFWCHITNQPKPDNFDIVTTVLFSIRIPRTFVAAMTGAALAAAGVLSQGLFRNPLASPSVLGTESGAAALAALSFYVGSTKLQWFFVPCAAIMGAFATTLFLLYIITKSKTHSVENLLLLGIAINAFLGAATSLVVSFSLERVEGMHAVMYWLMGGFNGKGWEYVTVGLPPIVLGLIWAYHLCAKLDVLVLGEEIAATLSIDTAVLRKTVIIVISLLVGTAISMAGAITFVGLIVPHISRLIVGSEHRRVLMVSIINGISLLVIADLIARTVRSPMELQVGVLIAMMGAAFFFWLLIRNWNRGL